jgi:hydrogenase maturation protease
MGRVLVLGYGNPLRGDDGAGRRIAEELEARGFDGYCVQVQILHQLLPEVAETLSHFTHAVFVDASLEGTPGRIAVQTLVPQGCATAFSHELDPASLLASAEILYGHTPESILVSVAGRSFEPGEGLSAEVQAAIPAAVEWIRDWIEEQTQKVEQYA